jgi:tetratricopeptide (TPR) repeat protein
VIYPTVGAESAIAAESAVAAESAAEAESAVAAPAVAAPAVERRTSRRRAGPAGIGGLLLLPVIGLILTICWNGWSIYHDLLPFRQSEAWTALTTPGSDIYHWLWQPLALFEVFTAIVMVIAPIALLVLIFRKRRSARGFTVAFYVFCCVAAAVDSGAGLLFMVGWLRSIGLNEAASAISTNSLYGLYQVAVLAAVWIPYLLLSRRVKNTFVNPAPTEEVDPAYVLTAADQGKKVGGRLRGALAVLLIVVVAAAVVYAFNTYLSPAADAGFASTKASSDSQRLTQQADAALTAGNWDQAIGLYTQAIQADPAYGPAYYGEWTALLQKQDLGPALQVATKITQQFSDSRQAWFVLGYTQEAQGDLKSAVSSYTKSLELPQIPAAGGTPITDTEVQQRLDLVSYVTAITEPRLAIAAAVNNVNTALAGTTPDAAALSTSAAQVTTVLTSNIAELARITPPAYFAAFHSGMLAAYGGLESACEGLATAASSSDATALASARKSLNDAIDGFNQNDAVGTSLINDYYGQEPPIALAPPANPGS